MAKRTYLPELLRILNHMCKYVATYRETILKFLPEGSESTLDAAVSACIALSEVLIEVIPRGS